MKNLLNHKDNDDVFITNRRYNKIKYHYKQNMIFDEYKHYPSTTEEDHEGYLVIYPDGYESWSPKHVFEEAYREVSDKEKQLIIF